MRCSTWIRGDSLAADAQRPTALLEAVELVPMADGPLHNAIVRLNVGVLLRSDRFGKLLDHFPAPEVLLYQLGHKLAAVVIADTEV